MTEEQNIVPEKESLQQDIDSIEPEKKETTEESTIQESLAEKLAEAEKKADEYLNMAQRARADYENLSRRTQGVRADSFEEGRRVVAATMLAVLDNLERALGAATEDSPLKQGVELTIRQMNDIYTGLGVTVINRIGEKFDPNLENAVMQGTSDEGEPGTVCQVLQKGYRMGDAVLRHAMVKVVAE